MEAAGLGGFSTGRLHTATDLAKEGIFFGLETILVSATTLSLPELSEMSSVEAT